LHGYHRCFENAEGQKNDKIVESGKEETRKETERFLRSCFPYLNLWKSAESADLLDQNLV